MDVPIVFLVPEWRDELINFTIMCGFFFCVSVEHFLNRKLALIFTFSIFFYRKVNLVCTLESLKFKTINIFKIIEERKIKTPIIVIIYSIKQVYVHLLTFITFKYFRYHVYIRYHQLTTMLFCLILTKNACYSRRHTSIITTSILSNHM